MRDLTGVGYRSEGVTVGAAEQRAERPQYRESAESCVRPIEHAQVRPWLWVTICAVLSACVVAAVWAYSLPERPLREDGRAVTPLELETRP